jgi:hypothetical protein
MQKDALYQKAKTLYTNFDEDTRFTIDVIAQAWLAVSKNPKSNSRENDSIRYVFHCLKIGAKIYVA